MDYEEKYKEALERAKYYKEGITDRKLENGENIMDYIFPELKESEDERIKRCISDAVRKYGVEFATGTITKEKMLAWLEKQGEQKLLNNDKYQTVPVKILDRLYESEKELERLKPGEHEPIVKVEPKFKVGDWFVENEPNNYARFIEILEVIAVQGKERYRISKDLHNDEDIVECRFVENYYHPFNIQDAKDGDVIVDNYGIIIFRKIGNYVWNDVVDFYISYNFKKGVIIQSDNTHCGSVDRVFFKPATKEERDLLFQKMKEAGYEWDFEKKELIKVEKKSAEWSEIEPIIQHLDNLGNTAMADILRSFEPQSKWKPSEEHMKALHDLNLTGDISYAGQGQVLIELYNDLKKLK